MCTLLVIVLTLFMRKLAGVGEKTPVLQHGLFLLDEQEFDKQKHQYTRQQVLDLKQSTEFKKMVQLRGGKKVDQWRSDSSVGGRVSSSERSTLSTPRKESAPVDF